MSFVLLSRLSFGVVTGRRAVLVIDSCVPEPARLQRLLEVASSALKEQFSSLEEFNVIRFSDRQFDCHPAAAESRSLIMCVLPQMYKWCGVLAGGAGGCERGEYW